MEDSFAGATKYSLCQGLLWASAEEHRWSLGTVDVFVAAFSVREQKAKIPGVGDWENEQIRGFSCGGE
jgi:hypothetical protein